jgi:hypothetical protein
MGGSISYRIEIRIKRAGKIVWRKSGTFPRKKLAEVCAVKREVHLAVVFLAHRRRMKWVNTNHTRKDLIPMDKIIVFAIFSSRKQGEFSRMLRSDCSTRI